MQLIPSPSFVRGRIGSRDRSRLRAIVAALGLSASCVSMPSEPGGTGGAPGSGGAAQGTGGSTPAGAGGSTPAGMGGTNGSGGENGVGGRAGTGGMSGTGGRAGTGGATATGGRAGTGGTPAGTGGSAPDAGTDAPTTRFSFFVTSIEAMRALSGSPNGFGGDLRFNEATGLAGADKICTETAKRGMPGAEAKTWRAFLSATTGGTGGGAVNAIDRVGNGPWYDRMGRLVAMTRADLMQTRPRGANVAIIEDLPNENGVPNQQGTDNHDTLTGSTATGMLSGNNAAATCNDWTSKVGSTGRPMLGHSWSARSGLSWIQAHAAAGCGADVNIALGGGMPPAGSTGVGSGGGYGGIYCFALQP